MATNTINLPEGFVLDTEQDISQNINLPEGFVLDNKPSQDYSPTLSGELMTPRTFKQEQWKRDMASGRQGANIGQFLGGIGGAAAFPVHPYVGAAAGGTLGRTAGRLYQKQIGSAIEAVKNKDLIGLATAMSPLFTVLKMKPEEKQALGQETVKTAITETAIAPVGVALNFAGKGVLKGLLGARTAERGFERGFKKILDPEFYKNRVPKMIAEKTSKFFNRLSTTTGQAIEKLLKSKKYNTASVLVKDLKDDVIGVMPEGYTDVYKYIDDLIPATRPNIEKTVLKQETKKILSMGGAKRKIYTLWNQRKALDKLINSRNWGEEASDYLIKLRKILNDPIKSAGEDVSMAFNKYHFVKEGEYDLGKRFMAVRSPAGEIYASPAESFAADIMSTKKDDLIRRLKDLDSLANAPDKVIEDFLDYAASESLDKKVGFGIFQEMLVGMLGGRRSIARLGALGQQPLIKAGKTAIGRGVVTGISDIAND